METKELRIGNYVTINNLSHLNMLNGKLLKIILIDYVNVDIKAKEFKYNIGLYYSTQKINIHEYLEYIDPIPITEKLLLNFGFKKDLSTNSFLKVSHFQDMEDLKFELILNTETNQYYYQHKATEIKYVHQLQNLFFDLTGKELKL